MDDNTQQIQEKENRPATKHSSKANEVLVGGQTTKYRLMKKIGELSLFV